jgi:hypothetical protein
VKRLPAAAFLLLALLARPTLAAAAGVAGRVIDSADGSPVAGARITLQSAGDPPLVQTATTDARGAFRLPEVGNGAWTLSATGKGYATAQRDVKVDGAAVEGLEIRLDPTQGVTIVALLANGHPPDRIQVAAIDADGRTVASGIYRIGRIGTSPTEENGRVRIPEVPAGQWQLLVESEDSAPVLLTATAPGPVLRALLPPGGEVRVQVPALVGDVASATVVLTGPKGPFRSIDRDGSVRSEWDISGGSFDFTRVPAGLWQVVAQTEDGRSWTGSVNVTPGEVVEVVVK